MGETEPAYNANYYYRHGRTWQTCDQNRSAAHLETARVPYLHAAMRILKGRRGGRFDLGPHKDDILKRHPPPYQPPYIYTV